MAFWVGIERLVAYAAPISNAMIRTPENKYSYMCMYFSAPTVVM